MILPGPQFSGTTTLNSTPFTWLRLEAQFGSNRPQVIWHLGIENIAGVDAVWDRNVHDIDTRGARCLIAQRLFLRLRFAKTRATEAKTTTGTLSIAD